MILFKRIPSLGLLLFALYFTGCTSTPPTQLSEKQIPPAADSAAPDQPQAVEGEFPAWKDGPLTDSFRRSFDPDEVTADLVQFHRILESYDYFGQYTWGDTIFEDYLITIYGIEDGPYYPGRGVERTLYDQDGSVQNRYSRVLLETGEEGSFWQHRQSRYQEEIFYETVVGPYGVPREIRFVEAVTGSAVGRTTILGENVVMAETEMAPEEIRARLAEERGEEVHMYLPPFYAGLHEEGRETIEVAGRSLHVVKMTSESLSENINSLELFYSPDVPGGLVRLRINDWTVAEVTGWIDEGKQVIPEDEISRMSAFADMDAGGPEYSDDFYSEGSAQQPVELYPGESYYGAVSTDGPSYYMVRIPERGDLHCVLSEMSGPAALYSYGDDKSFSDWYSGTEGMPLEYTEYYVGEDDTFYFTVELSEYGEEAGLFYTITPRIDPMLDPLGVRLHVDYTQNAEELSVGADRKIPVVPGDLRFFRVIPGQSDSLKITVNGIIPDALEFDFLEVLDGSYSGMSGMQYSAEERVIELSGLAPGCTVYLYLVASMTIGDEMLSVTVE